MPFQTSHIISPSEAFSFSLVHELRNTLSLEVREEASDGHVADFGATLVCIVWEVAVKEVLKKPTWG